MDNREQQHMNRSQRDPRERTGEWNKSYDSNSQKPSRSEEQIVDDMDNVSSRTRSQPKSFIQSCAVVPQSTTVQISSSDDASSAEHVRPGHVVKDWFELSTIHGIIDLTRPQYGRIWKATWIAVMLGFAVITVYSVSETVCECIKNPTIQNYVEESINEIVFPDVVVCTHERLNATALEEAGASEALIRVLKDNLQSDGLAKLITARTTGFKSRGDNKNLSNEYDALRRKLGDLHYEDILRRFGIDCEAVIKYCASNNIPETNCCDRVFVSMDAIYGKCYRLRALRTTDSRQQTFPGAGAGVQLGLSRPAGSANKAMNALRGILVEFVHPEEAQSYTYHQVPSGVMASVQLSLQETRRINIFNRRRTCIEGVSHSELFLIPNDTDGRIPLSALRRSARGCFQSMWTHTVNKSCRCTQVPGLIEVPLCEPFDECLTVNWSELVNESVRLKAIECLPQCTKRAYTTTITYSAFDARAFFDQLDGASELEVVDDLIVLDIFHPQMQYLRVQEVEVYSVMTAISNIGGSIGLWLGASLMSILQMIFYFAKWLSLWKKK